MSDMMGPQRPPMGGTQPPSGGMTPPKDAMSANRSIMNPVDMAAMSQSGTVTQNMTIKDYIEKVIKVPIDAPVQALAEAIKKQGQNQSGIGKVGAMSQAPGMGQPAPPPMPQGRPPAVPAPRPQQGLADLTSR